MNTLTNIDARIEALRRHQEVATARAQWLESTMSARGLSRRQVTELTGVPYECVKKYLQRQRAVSDDAWGRLQGLASHSQPDHDNKPTAVQNG